LQSKLGLDAYNQKYANQVSSSKTGSSDSVETKENDQMWKFVKKQSINRSMDAMDEPKGSFFNEEGQEMASED